MTHFPDQNAVPYKRFMVVMKTLIGPVYPDLAGTIEFRIGKEKARGANDVRIIYSLSPRTAKHLEYKLEQFFEQVFKISAHKVEISLEETLRLEKAINDAAHGLLNDSTPSGTPAPNTLKG